MEKNATVIRREETSQFQWFNFPSPVIFRSTQNQQTTMSCGCQQRQQTACCCSSSEPPQCRPTICIVDECGRRKCCEIQPCPPNQCPPPCPCPKKQNQCDECEGEHRRRYIISGLIICLILLGYYLYTYRCYFGF